MSAWLTKDLQNEFACVVPIVLYIDLFFLLGGHKKQQTVITRLRDFFSPPNFLQLCVIMPLTGSRSHCAMRSVVF